MNAQFLNANKLAQSSGISQPTAMNYVQYMEAMMVVKRVPVFFRNPAKRLIKHPKIYTCDPLLINEYLGNHFSVQICVERGQIGQLYETFIFNEIQKTLSNYGLIAGIFTWRTQDGAEVDIVLSSTNGLIPIETKWSNRLTSKDASGLHSFMECYPEVKHGYIVYPGEGIQKVSPKVTAVPDWWFLGF